MKRCVLLSIVFVLCTVSLLSAEKKKQSKFTLFSKSFRNGRMMPVELATLKIKGGRNKSPSLYWKNVPEGTKSFAVICLDTHPVAKRWIHWMIINIPVSCDHIVSGASSDKMPDKSIELYNSFGDIGWGGPQPPKGTGLHKYLFKIYALKSKKLPINIENEKEFNLAVKKAGILGKAFCYGLFRQD